jgi:hypothetical protein
VPRYFLDLPDERNPRTWDPHAGPHPARADTRYFGGVFREMERTLLNSDIDVHLTWSAKRLPSYGKRVVAVVLRDETGQIPRYSGRVLAVFKCYGSRPQLGAGPLRNPTATGLLELAQYAVRWLRWLPGALAHLRLLTGRRLRGKPVPARVYVIPPGTYNQLELPVRAIEQRHNDLFFAGSVAHGPSLRRALSPKTHARREMLAAVGRLGRRRPDLCLDLRVTVGFAASAAASPQVYSHALMNARVCLAPRGTSVETFRVFEGLRAGCVVVAERLPRYSFYEGAPILTLDRWRDLERTLEPVLDDPQELRRLHEASRAWWTEHCSEEAVGRFLAERLNALERGADMLSRSS